MTSGWVKIHRDMLEWEWWDDHNTTRLFIYLILSANHDDKKWRGLVIKRGQVLTGRKKLAESVGLTEQQTRTSLNKLKSTNEITIKTTNNYSIITITNYNKHQQNNQPDNQRITNEQPTDNHKQELKNKRNNINTIGIDALSISDIEQWLNEKRAQGKYLTIDEHRLLEKFKDYCKSKGKKYKDYVAAFRNAFEWDNAPKKGNGNGKPTVADILAENRREIESLYADSDSGTGEPVLRGIEHIRENH